MGVRYGTRALNSLCKPISTGKLSKPTYVLQRAKPLNTGGGGCPTREGDSGQGTQPSTPGKFLFDPLSCSQEGWSDETGNQPQEVEQMGGAPKLQDGGYGDPQSC